MTIHHLFCFQEGRNYIVTEVGNGYPIWHDISDEIPPADLNAAQVLGIMATQVCDPTNKADRIYYLKIQNTLGFE